jgi:hypothetical protein
MPAHDASAPSFELAAEALVAASALDMTSSAGAVVEIWTLSNDGNSIRATAPRLDVREGIDLRADLPLEGLPYTVTAHIAEAGYRSPARAALVLVVTDVSPTGARRLEDRVGVATNVTMTAVSCGRLLEGDTMDTVAVDVSPSGIGLSVLDSRVNSGDIFAVHCRFIHGEVNQRVQVVRTTSFDSGQRIAGCRFVDGTAATNAVIDRVMHRDVGANA